MNKFSGVLILIFIIGACAQDVTQDLQRAQEDLVLSHRFIEESINLNRNQVSNYINRINIQILDSHIDSYAFIKNIGLNVTAEIDAIEVTNFNEQCLDSLRNRWNIQIRRYGIRLSNCVSQAFQLLSEKNSAINDLHITAQGGNIVQNSGVNVLSDTRRFDERDQFSATINRAHRELLKSFLSNRSRFDGFLDQLAEDYTETIRALVQCDRNLEAEFVDQQAVHLGLARRCESLTP